MTVKITAPHSGQEIWLHGAEFTELCQSIHTFNKQWWIDPATGEKKDRNVGEMLMLMTSELSEASEGDPSYNAMLMPIVNRLSAALEGHRKNKMDEHLPQFHSIDVELVDCIIRAMDLLGARYATRVVHVLAQGDRLDVQPDSPGDIFEAKCAYNANRADHRPENRIAPGGKAY